MRLRCYSTARGVHPVAEYVEELSRNAQAVIAAAFADVAERGFKARGVTLRQIEGKLREIRIGPHRVFYVRLGDEEMVLLHAYRKQSQQAPTKHLAIARRRMLKVLQ